jgi:hypothetical protein
MKKVFVWAAISLIVVLSCKKSTSTGPSDVHLNTGLLLYLPFNGNIIDSSGNGNTTAAVGGAALVSDQKGNASSAFGGTGKGERIFVTNNGSIHFDTAFSISLDVSVTSLKNMAFLTLVDNATANGVSFGFGMGIVGLNNLDFSTSDSLSNCGNFVAANNNFADTTLFIPQPGVWYNLIGIYHKGMLTVYTDGKLISTYTVPGTTVPVCLSSKVIVGGWWDGDPQSIDGKLDEVRLYNRVLNADEIAALSKNFQ